MKDLLFLLKIQIEMEIKLFREQMSLSYWADWILLLCGSGKTSLESEQKEICLKVWILSLSMNIEDLLTPTRSYIYESRHPYSVLYGKEDCVYPKAFHKITYFFLSFSE